MRIIIDIGHPAHVHLFKEFARQMIMKGHAVLFTIRDKEYESEILSNEGFNFISFGKHYSSITGKLKGAFKYTVLLYLTAKKFKPDLLLSHGSFYAAWVSWLTGKIHIALEDSANMEQVRLYRPFTKAILTPDVLPVNLGRKQIKYPGFHELAYLHPKVFKPSGKILEYTGIGRTEPFCIMRFVAWNATHDIGKNKISHIEKIELVRKISADIRVFISAEGELPDELKELELKINPVEIHNLLSYAALYIGEGATMAAESAILGTPAIYFNKIIRYYNEDLESFGLVFNYRSMDGVYEKATEILHMTNRTSEFKNRRDVMLNKKIYTTEFLIKYINATLNNKSG